MIWLVVAVGASLAASAMGTYFIFNSNLPEILNPELKSLRLKHEILQQRDQRLQELLRALNRARIIPDSVHEHIRELAMKGIMMKSDFATPYQIDPNRVLDVGHGEPSRLGMVYTLVTHDGEIGVIWKEISGVRNVGGRNDLR